jgi:hypothetical protein
VWSGSTDDVQAVRPPRVWAHETEQARETWCKHGHPSGRLGAIASVPGIGIEPLTTEIIRRRQSLGFFEEKRTTKPGFNVS